MTIRKTVTALAALLAAIAVAACGPAATPTGGPDGTSAAVATQAPVATDGPGLSFDVPNDDVELESLLPDEIGGQALQKASMGGETFLEGGGEDFVAVLTQLGKTPADLSTAFGSTSSPVGNVMVQVSAFRVSGVEANQLWQTFVDLIGEPDGDVISDVSFGGKSVKKNVSVDGDVSYSYASGDVLFGVDSSDDIPAELLNEIFSKLR